MHYVKIEMMGDKKLVSNVSLNDFFYSTLSKKNKFVTCPLPEEFIFYSSLTLEKYAFSHHFFENDNGNVNEKILGLQFLYSQGKAKEEKISELKDVGDMVLVQLGLFSESVNKKLTNKSYYMAIAQNAYQQLDKLDMQFYDIPNFYKLFATSLDKTIKLLELVAEDFNEVENSSYLLNLEVPHKKAI